MGIVTMFVELIYTHTNTIHTSRCKQHHDRRPISRSSSFYKSKSPNHANYQAGWWLGHPSEKYEFVNWDDYSQYMGK